MPGPDTEPNPEPMPAQMMTAAPGTASQAASPAADASGWAAPGWAAPGWAASADASGAGMLLLLLLLITCVALGALLRLHVTRRAERSALARLQRQRPLLHARLHRARRQLDAQRDQRDRMGAERRQWRQSMRDARARIERQDLLLASLGHEIRSPLRSLLAVVELLDRDLDPGRDALLRQQPGQDPAQHPLQQPLQQPQKQPQEQPQEQPRDEFGPPLGQQLRIISDLARHVLKVADDSLELATIERGAATLDAARFELEVELERALRAIGARSTRRVHLAVDFEPGMPLAWIGDAARLRQILINLLGNALDHTEHGAVTVSFARPRGGDGNPAAGLALTVRDSGTGIAPGEQSRIFEPFVQGAASGGLAGLGLSVVARLTELMDGEIRVDSELGVGSTFTVTLPLPPADGGFPAPSRRSRRSIADDVSEAPVPRDDAAAAASPLCDHRCALCVDHPIERHALAGYLSHWGAQVEVFADPDAIRARLAAGMRLQTAIVALDTMPARLAQLAALRLAHPELHIIESRDEAAAECFWPSALAAALSSGAGPARGQAPDALPSAARTALQPLAHPGEHGEHGETITAPAPTPSARGARVMIVDDHPVARRVLLDVLSSLGCSVIAAEDGRSALEIAEDPEECFDWVLLDRQMPGIDGLATAAALRGRCATRGAQLALLVNESGGTHPEQGLVDTVLVRPAGIDALRDALSALLCASSPAALQRAAAGSAGARSASARSADASTADADLQRLRDETLIEDLDGLSSAFEQNDLQSADAHLHRMQGALRICPEPRRCAAILDLQERLAADDQAGTRVSIQCLGELLAREAFRGADPA